MRATKAAWAAVGLSLVGLDIPKQPFQGQRRPPCERPYVEIRGGCWVVLGNVSPPCGDKAYEWKGSCYIPVGAPLRPSTSEEPKLPGTGVQGASQPREPRCTPVR